MLSWVLSRVLSRVREMVRSHTRMIGSVVIWRVTVR